MRIIADLHIHTRYSRATSKEMTLPTIAHWAKRKGITLVGTGDFTHPQHLKAIEEELVPAEEGLFLFEDTPEVRFMLTAEISNIYSEAGRLRKIHTLVFAPSLEAARRLTDKLKTLGNVYADGRPIFGFSVVELLKMALDISEDFLLVPAHAWTPWFSIFGSKSGFDSIEECFGDYSRYIHAIETGLSSNPEMNWRLSALDGITLLSNSDAHSPAKLGREANVFSCELSYPTIMDVIKTKDPERFLFTIEFFPEEGKYHYDGHRECGVVFSPEETRKAGGLCPVCGKGVTVGVMNRVEELADRPQGFVPEGAIPQRSLIPLEEIIAEALGKGVNTAAVKKEYRRMTDAYDEFTILMDLTEEELQRIAHPMVMEGILKMRRGDVKISPGFDGEFGKIKLFEEPEKPQTKGPTQMGLF